MTTYTLDELARATGLALLGDASVRIARACPPADAGPGDLAVAMNPDYAKALGASRARAAIVWDGAEIDAFGLDGALVAKRPRVALAHLTDALQHPVDVEPGIHPTAVTHPSAKLGANVSVAPFAVIGARAEIGANSIIGPHVTVGDDAQIGEGALLHAGTRIGARCLIGARFVSQQNSIVGSDGFSFEPPERGAVEAVRQTGEVSARNELGFLRIHSLAPVEIGDDVEIGAATAIDRGTLAPTRVGSGTKIDNQVQIGHNVQLGSMCLVCAQVGIAGSAKIGDRVVLGGRVGIGDHITIGSDVVCAAGTLIGTNVPSRSVMMGIPGVNRDLAVRQIMAVRRLPRLLEQVSEIRKKLGM